MGPTARICCLDLDCFFVSVERLLDPSLEGKAIIVGGRTGSRGVVTACSYEVRKFGVRSGMPMAEATRLAPHALCLPTRHGVYSPYAKQVRAVLEDFTPVVQTASIDEFFLDFRGCEDLYRTAADASDDASIDRVVRQMRQRIRDEVGLPASAGIGTSRMMAKVASNLAKPAGSLLVPSGGERAVLDPLSVRKIPGIGPKTEARLTAVGIHTVADLLELPPGKNRARFGDLSIRLHRTISEGTPSLSRDRPAFLEHDPAGVRVGSISNERTFAADIGDECKIADQLNALCERVSWRARKRQMLARTVTLKLRYSDFHTITRSQTMPPSNRERDIAQVIRALFQRARTRDLPIRLLGVGLTNFIPPDQQLSLPFANRERPAPGAAIDQVRTQFGYDAIRLGSVGQGTRWVA